MAASAIKDLFNGNSTYATNSDLTLTFASLASSTTFVGRQSTVVDNTTNRYGLIHVFCKFKQGTSPTGSRGVYMFAIRSDKNASAHRSDNAGASDAAWTRANAEYIGTMRNLSSPATGDVLYGEAFIVNPGPEWGVGLYHDTGVNADSTGGNFWLRYVGNVPEAQ